MVLYKDLERWKLQIPLGEAMSKPTTEHVILLISSSVVAYRVRCRRRCYTTDCKIYTQLFITDFTDHLVDSVEARPIICTPQQFDAHYHGGSGCELIDTPSSQFVFNASAGDSGKVISIFLPYMLIMDFVVHNSGKLPSLPNTRILAL